MSGEDEQWFYCLKHHTVEGALGCRAKDRLGPYPTRAEAEQALEKVKERNDAWKAQDPRED